MDGHILDDNGNIGGPMNVVNLNNHHHMSSRNTSRSTANTPSWPRMIDVEYLMQKNKSENKIVYLNVGGTKFEVRKKRS